MISGGGTLTLSAAGGAVQAKAKLGGGDRWVYPLFQLHADERASAEIDALQFSISIQAGKGQFRVIFDKENGSSYVAELTIQPRSAEGTETIAFLSDALHGSGWSKPDPDGRLRPEQIRAFKIGCNPTTENVIYAIKNVRWVKLER
jgi:hypothetical protein